MILKIEDIDPVQQIDGNCVLSKNGDISFVFSVNLPDKYSLGETDFDHIFLDKLRFYSMLPSNTVIHNQNTYLQKAYNGTGSNKTFLQKAFNDHFVGREYLDHLSFMYITLTNIKSLNKTYYNSNFFRSSKKEDFVKIDLKRINDFYKSVERAVQFMNNSHYIKLSPLSELQIETLLLNYETGFNGRKLTDIQFKPEFLIGDNYFRSYAITNSSHMDIQEFTNIIPDTHFSTPESPYYKSFFEPLGLDFNFNHTVNQYVYLDEHKDHIKELDQRLDKLGTFSAYSAENKLGAKKLKEYVDSILEDGTIQLMRSHINILTWSKDKEELDYIDNKLVAVMQELDLLPYSPKLKEQSNYFLSSIPTNAGCLPRIETFNTELKKSICFDITESRYKSDEKGIVLNDRITNLPVLKDVYYKPYKNKIISSRNFFIIAPTGGGKSVFLLKLLRTFLEDDFTCILIDLGGTSEVLSKLYPEETLVVKFEQGKPLGINPFLIKDIIELDSNKLELLRDFVSILWLKDEDINPTYKVSLGKIIKDYYQYYKGKYDFYTFFDYVKDNQNDLIERLDIAEFFPMTEFLHLLSEYYKDGMYEFLFKDYEQIQGLQGKKFIIFELEQIRNNETLLPVVLAMLRDTTDNLVFKNVTGKKLLAFEEAAESLKNPAILNIVDYFYQTGRKYGCATGVVLQYIDNIPDNKKGAAIIQNTPIYYLLEHDKKFKILQDRLELTNHTMYQLKSIRNDFVSDKKYTEVIVCFTNKQSNIYRLEIPKQELLCYISEKEEKQIILDEYAECGDMETTINNIIQKELL
jgi:conjugal transfer ATP-binding protein TraC